MLTAISQKDAKDQQDVTEKAALDEQKAKAIKTEEEVIKETSGVNRVSVLAAQIGAEDLTDSTEFDNGLF